MAQLICIIFYLFKQICILVLKHVCVYIFKNIIGTENKSGNGRINMANIFIHKHLFCQNLFHNIINKT